HVYRGATTADYEVQADIGYQPAGKKYKIAYSCGNYFFVNDPDGVKYLDGESHGFIKKSDAETVEPPNKISVDTRAYFLRINGTAIMDTEFSFEPNYASKKVSYRSLNTNVATVSSTGLITAKGIGSTKIEIKSIFGSACAYYNVHVLQNINSESVPKALWTQVANMSIEEIKAENTAYKLMGNSQLPEDCNGYDKVYEIGNSVGWCDTREFLFECEKAFSTNCFGFAINKWNGIILEQGSGATNLECWVNGAVKSIETLGGTAQILTGSDNNPNYPTDDEHLLIALKVPMKISTSAYFSDSYHFMVRKGGDWYFKGGSAAQNGIYKVLNHKTPEQVAWSAYQNCGSYIRELASGYYDSKTQYIVISKMPTMIDGR
ncbi:MAG: Ig-like domain-containing protein, partial [Eubacterium sp.]|nr:Ig-like domain-containing protein [Eubacterium sp.]